MIEISAANLKLFDETIPIPHLYPMKKTRASCRGKMLRYAFIKESQLLAVIYIRVFFFKLIKDLRLLVVCHTCAHRV